MNSETLRKKILQMPAEIKNWLGSDEVISHIKKFGSKFNINPTKQSIIPKLILRVGIKDLEPKYFAGRLSMELEMDKGKATAITAEIKKNIFLPIKREFLDYGIEIERLDEFEIPIHETYKNEPEEKVIVLESFDENDSSQEKIISIKEDLPKTKTNEEKPFDVTQGKPLIIHEEKASGAAEETEVQKRQNLFSAPFRFFEQKLNPAEERPAVKVRVETPEKKKEDIKRVVHYSEFRTPVAPLTGKEGIFNNDIDRDINENKDSDNNINTDNNRDNDDDDDRGGNDDVKGNNIKETIVISENSDKPQKNKFAFGWTLKPPAESPQKLSTENIGNQPKLDGNTIDLR